MIHDPHRISLKYAIALTQRWREQNPNSLKAGKFDRIAFDKLLAVPGCAGIRTYMGVKEDGSWTFVMVATDANGKDIVHDYTAANGEAECPPIEQEILPCPPYCDDDSPLNNR